MRQQLVHRMIHSLDYPSSYLVVEKALKQMPHLTLQDKPIPDRRADLICYAKGIHPQHDLYPLLLVECKATKITQKVINQVVGYNYHLRAYFVAVANDHEIQTGWLDPAKGAYTFVPYLPSYPQLVRSWGQA